MFRIYHSFFKQYLFWLIYFALGRGLFMLFYAADIVQTTAPLSEVLMAFAHGFKLDVATTGYVMVLPFFLHLIKIFYSPPALSNVNRYYHFILIVLYALMVTAEIGLYGEWHSKLNYKALLYLQHPTEVMNSAPTGQFVGLLLLWVAMSAIGIWLYAKYFHKRLICLQLPNAVALSFLLFMPPVLLLLIRGGVEEIPITQSQSYYSKHHILNAAATNTAFNLYISYHENRNSTTNPFVAMDTSIAKAKLAAIYHTPKDSSLMVLKEQRPNVVLIIMESWSATLIDTPKDKSVVTPRFRQLMQEGLYFDNLYASGPRSEQGLASIFSGFPAHPITSVTVQPDKYAQLPSMVKDFKAQGYHTAFSFGGQLIYGNIKSYIMFNAFDQIKEVYDYDQSLPRGKLGVHDEFTLQQLKSDLGEMPQPFFAAHFTLSTHSPYDQPMEQKIDWGGGEQNYLNGAYYTDYSIGRFIDSVKQCSWYPNTLFIFVADHSHGSYNNLPMSNIEYQKIPMLWYGEPLKDSLRGKRIEHLGIQTDLAATLLPQLQMSAQSYPWSKNLLNPYAPQFAYTAYEIGYAWKRPAGFVSYAPRDKYYFHRAEPQVLHDSLRQEGDAFLQRLFQSYLNL